MVMRDFTSTTKTSSNGEVRRTSPRRVTRAHQVKAAQIYVAASKLTGKPVPAYIDALARERDWPAGLSAPPPHENP